LLIVEVRGYTDNVGKMDHNLALSLRRANKVKDELVTIYGISAKRIVTNGKGVVLESKADPHLSRRCSFFFDK